MDVLTYCGYDKSECVRYCNIMPAVFVVQSNRYTKFTTVKMSYSVNPFGYWKKGFKLQS